MKLRQVVGGPPKPLRKFIALLPQALQLRGGFGITTPRLSIELLPQGSKLQGVGFQLFERLPQLQAEQLAFVPQPLQFVGRRGAGRSGTGNARAFARHERHPLMRELRFRRAVECLPC